MKWIKHPLVLALAMTVLSQGAFGQVSASLSAEVVGEFEPVTLTINARGNEDAEPDMSALESDFEITSSGTQSRFEIINGRFNSSKQWTFVLMPKRSGTINIQPIPVGNQQTNGLRLSVRPVSKAERDLVGKTAFFETITSHDTQYPQAAIYITRRMLYTAQAQIPSVPKDKALQIENATVIPLASVESLQENRNGEMYYVMQWRFVVFAEKSGTLHIPGESARIAIYNHQFRPQFRTITAEAKNITILPIPDEFPHDSPWFPASKIELSQVFNPTVFDTLELGEAITRTIQLRAQNSYESALLPLELGEILGLRIYPEQSATDTVLENNVVWGTKSRVFNLIAVEPGIVQLPAFTLTWWDIQSEQVRTTTLPAVSFNIPSPSVVGGEELDESIVPIQEPVLVRNDSVPVSHDQSSWLIALAVVAITGWVLVLGVIVFRNSFHKAKKTHQKSPHQVNDAAIRQAIVQKDASALRQAVLSLLAQRLNINRVVARAVANSTPSGVDLMTKLDDLVYGSSISEFDFEFKDIKQLIDSIAENAVTKEKEFGLHSIVN